MRVPLRLHELRSNAGHLDEAFPGLLTSRAERPARLESHARGDRLGARAQRGELHMIRIRSEGRVDPNVNSLCCGGNWCARSGTGCTRPLSGCGGRARLPGVRALTGCRSSNAQLRRPRWCRLWCLTMMPAWKSRLRRYRPSYMAGIRGRLRDRKHGPAFQQPRKDLACRPEAGGWP